MYEPDDDSDSQPMSGGRIPGAPGAAAFIAKASSGAAIPIVIAAPHGGRVYSQSLLRDLRHGQAVALKLEDRYVDTLAQAVAAATGAALLVAQAPRALIDLNRAPEDIDWDMFQREARPAGVLPMSSRRARSGLGLVPRRLPGMGELWRRKLDAQELAERIDYVHAPYHAALATMLATARERWGAVLLIDLHSMPSLSSRPGAPGAQVVLGDRFGASCHGRIVAGAFAHFAQVGREAAHNQPYAGGYVLERHGDLRGGIHALQVEIDRARYLDGALAEPGPGMDGMIEDLAKLVRRLATIVADLGHGNGWALAAE